MKIKFSKLACYSSFLTLGVAFFLPLLPEPALAKNHPLNLIETSDRTDYIADITIQTPFGIRTHHRDNNGRRYYIHEGRRYRVHRDGRHYRRHPRDNRYIYVDKRGHEYYVHKHGHRTYIRQLR